MAWSSENPAVSFQRDEHGDVRLIRHFQYPFEYQNAEPRRAVVEYLRAVRQCLALDAEAIDHLAATIPPKLCDEGEWSRDKGIRLRWKPAFPVRRKYQA